MPTMLEAHAMKLTATVNLQRGVLLATLHHLTDKSLTPDIPREKLIMAIEAALKISSKVMGN